MKMDCDRLREKGKRQIEHMSTLPLPPPEAQSSPESNELFIVGKVFSQSYDFAPRPPPPPLPSSTGYGGTRED
jgi:hypothetical protein